jgi:hypothetical protein
MNTHHHDPGTYPVTPAGYRYPAYHERYCQKQIRQKTIEKKKIPAQEKILPCYKIQGFIAFPVSLWPGFLFRGIKSLKETFTGYQFFPGLKFTKEIISRVQAHICRAARESLVTNGVLFTVLTFHFFCHSNFFMVFSSYKTFSWNTGSGCR